MRREARVVRRGAAGWRRFLLAIGLPLVVGHGLQGAAASNLAAGTAAQGYQLRARVNIHTDARWFDGYEPAATDSLLFRRLSLNLEATLAEKLMVRLMPDFSASKVNVLDAYVAYRPAAAFTVLAGKTKSPFDLERLVSQTDLLFVERGFSSSLAPNRDVGLQVFGHAASQRLAYQIGWVNGVRDNDSAELSHVRPREAVARAFAQPFKRASHSPLRGLGVGLAVSAGTKSGVAPGGYRTLSQQRFFAWRSDVLHDGSHVRVEPQAYYHAGRLGLGGSWVASRPTLASTPRALRRRLAQEAWYVAGHWVVTGESASWSGLVPAQAFRWTRGRLGALELTARWSALAVDAAAFPDFANAAGSWRRARTVTAGCNWHLNAHVKAVLNLERTLFRGAALGASRAGGNAVLVRVQLRY